LNVAEPHRTDRGRTIPAEERRLDESRLAGGLWGVAAVTVATVALALAGLAVAVVLLWLL
jgi:hypothetical protein